MTIRQHAKGGKGLLMAAFCNIAIEYPSLLGQVHMHMCKGCLDIANY